MVQKETKNRSRLNILKSLVVVMFVLGLFSGIAAADTPHEKYQNDRERAQNITEKYQNARERAQNITEKYQNTKEKILKKDLKIAKKTNEKVRNIKEKYQNTEKRYQIYRDKYRIAGDKFKDAEQNFRDARNKFRTHKDKKSKEELKARAGQYLETGTDKMIAYLGVMKNRVNNSGNSVIPFDAAANIDTHIAKLEEIRTNIQQAGTPKELVDSARELKEQWNIMRLETGYVSGILINNRIDTFMTKSKNVSKQMDVIIRKFKNNGRDTAKLELASENFNEFINEARDNQQKVNDLYETHDGFNADGTVTDAQAARSFLKDAGHSQKDTYKKLKAAGQEVREFFKEAKNHVNKRKVVSGNGTLSATGNGRAVIKGDVNVTLSAINGTLVVSNNSEVATDGTGTKEELGNGNIKYEGFGSAIISGDGITVDISGNGIELTATGTGSAILNGNGTYKTEGDFGTGGEWNREG